jgi:hypothetical protein
MTAILCRPQGGYLRLASRAEIERWLAAVGRGERTIRVADQPEPVVVDLDEERIVIDDGAAQGE